MRRASNLEGEPVSQWIHAALGHERADDLRRTAARHHRAEEARAGEPRATWRSVELRPGFPGDRPELIELATAAREAPPAGPLLVAAHDGRIVAALELSTRRVVVDADAASAGVVDLLRLRAEQLAPRPKGRRFRRRPPRLAWTGRY